MYFLVFKKKKKTLQVIETNGQVLQSMSFQFFYYTETTSELLSVVTNLIPQMHQIERKFGGKTLEYFILSSSRLHG